MAENSGISWTHHTFNPWMGCTKVSPACKNCYAERDMDHRYGRVKWGPNGTRIRTSIENWRKPKKWNKEAEELGIRYRVFCASLADVFEDWSGPVAIGRDANPLMSESRLVGPDGASEWKARPCTLDDMRQDLFALIDATPHLDWLLLTKRPENIRRMWDDWRKRALPNVELCTAYRPNVWLGTSVENQEYADKRIPELLKCRDLAPVLFLSCEPLLGAVDLLEIEETDASDGDKRWWSAIDTGSPEGAKIDWVIAGGESGPNARPSHPDWFRSLRDQCDEADVPFHFKQWGEHAPADQCGGADPLAKMAVIHPSGKTFQGREKIPTGESVAVLHRVGVKKAGRLLDGVLHDAFPETVTA